MTPDKRCFYSTSPRKYVRAHLKHLGMFPCSYSKKMLQQSIISSDGSKKLVSLIFTFFRRDKKLNNFC